MYHTDLSMHALTFISLSKQFWRVGETFENNGNLTTTKKEQNILALITFGVIHIMLSFSLIFHINDGSRIQYILEVTTWL